jgi:hypothetical protein
MKNNITLAGISGDLFKLKEVASEVDQNELDSIFKRGKVVQGIYCRVRDGVMVIICVAKASIVELDFVAKAISIKTKDMKEKGVYRLNVFVCGV